MTTYVTVIKVGNSNGIIIPSGFMKALRLKEKDKLQITESDGVISLRRADCLGETPFSVLDRWNEDHCFPVDSLDSVQEYVENLRSSRVNKDIVQW